MFRLIRRPAVLPALVLGLALSACGPEEIVTTEPDSRGPAGSASAPPQSAQLVVVEEFEDLGSPVVALAAMPNAGEPWRGRVLAALQDGGVRALDVAQAAVREIEAPALSSMVTAPDFQLRGQLAPLVVATGPGVPGPTVYLYLSLDSDLLQPVPASPIAPDLEVQLVCPLRQSAAVLEFLVVGVENAQHWRLRDDGGDVLAAEAVADVPEAAGASACDSFGGGEAVVIGSDGLFLGGLSGRDLVVLEHRPNPAAVMRFALVARPRGGFIAADPDTGEPLFQVEVAAGLNTDAVERAAVMATAPGNYGGSYGGGVLLFGDGPDVSVLALDQAAEALAAQATAPEPTSDG